MKYVDVADALYGSNMMSILDVIRNSEEAEYFDQKINSMVIHTGFVFSTLKREKFVLLYDLTTSKVIRQMYNRESIPQLNGLLLAKINAKYFNLTTPIFCQEIICNNDIHKYYKIDTNNQFSREEVLTVLDDDQQIMIKTIRILKQHTLTPLKRYPLRRTLKEKVAISI